MNRLIWLLLTLGFGVLAAGGLILLASVDVAGEVASGAIIQGAIRIALGVLLVMWPLVRRDVERPVAIAILLLAASLFADGWVAIRLQAPHAELLSLLLVALASATLLIHLTRRPQHS